MHDLDRQAVGCRRHDCVTVREAEIDIPCSDIGQNVRGAGIDELDLDAVLFEDPFSTPA